MNSSNYQIRTFHNSYPHELQNEVQAYFDSLHNHKFVIDSVTQSQYGEIINLTIILHFV